MKITEKKIKNQFEKLSVEQDFSKIVNDAFSIALSSHKGQRRKYSDEPLLAHPFRVMKKLLPLNPSDEILAASLLHDVVEDTETSLEEIERKFGTYVAELVKGVTKRGKKDPLEILEDTAKDYSEVILIRLADRLDNFSDRDSLPERVLQKYYSQNPKLLDISRMYNIKNDLVDELRELECD